MQCASADCSWNGGEGLLGQVFTVYLCIMCGSNRIKVHIVVNLCRVMCRTVHCVSGSNHISPYLPLPYFKKQGNNSMAEESSRVKYLYPNHVCK